MAIEWVTVKQLSAILGKSERVARERMHEIGCAKVGGNLLVRRDALDRYLMARTERTIYTAPFMEEPIKPKYDRYARTGGRKHAAV